MAVRSGLNGLLAKVDPNLKIDDLLVARRRELSARFKAENPPAGSPLWLELVACELAIEWLERSGQDSP